MRRIIDRFFIQLLGPRGLKTSSVVVGCLRLGILAVGGLAAVQAAGPTILLTQVRNSLENGEVYRIERYIAIDSVVSCFLADWIDYETRRQDSPFPALVAVAIRDDLAQHLIRTLRNHMRSGVLRGMDIDVPMVIAHPFSDENVVSIEIRINGERIPANVRLRRTGYRWRITEVVDAPELVERLGI